MFKAVTVSVSLFLCAAFAAAGTFTGKFTWVQGTAVATILARPTAQTIQLKVGTVTKTYTNTFVCGVPGTSWTAGTPIMLLASGSQPFAGSFSTGSLVACNNSDFGQVIARRTVPMSTTGVLSANVALVNQYGSSGLDVFFPSFTQSGISCPNGMFAIFQVDITGYTITLPTGSATTFSAVTFPTTSPALNNFKLYATGNGILQLSGSSTSNTVVVAANTLYGPATELTDVKLTVSGGQIQ